MSTSTKRGKTKTSRSSGDLTRRADQALAFAEELRPRVDNWMQLHNALFGVGGKLTGLFATPAERAGFMQTPQHGRIQAMLEELRDAKGDGDLTDLVQTASGYMSVRLPKSLHAALLTEAETEGVSLNQLCVAKLAVQLRSTVVK